MRDRRGRPLCRTCRDAGRWDHEQMPARLIVNADDFGLTAGINRAVGELHAAGILTSATLMANGPAFEDAVAIARVHPGLGVGCHVVLTDGVPVSDPAMIPTLMGRSSATLRPQLGDFVRALMLGRIREDDIATEARAQIEKIQQAGIHITHLDTHKHTHLFPAVLRPLLRVAQQTGIPAMRSPFEPRWAAGLGHGTPLRRTAIGMTRLIERRFTDLLRISGLGTTDGTLAISATGDLTQATLGSLLRGLPADGVFELCCHPGYNDAELDRVRTKLRAHRDVEREALLAVWGDLRGRSGAPELVTYGQVAGDVMPCVRGR